VKIKTKNFGEIKFTKEEIITFSEGLPGFCRYKKFIIFEAENSKPFIWLISIAKKDLVFAVVDPKIFRPNYKVLAAEEELKSIEIENPGDAQIYTLVTMENNSASLNLKAPIIINKTNNKGMQVILKNSDYDIEYNIVKKSSKTEMKYHQYENSLKSDFNEKRPEATY
jgi:flagellar assembly factor FliW